MRDRKLRNFEVLHVVLYSNKFFLSPWLRGLQQWRHDCKETGGEGLLYNLLKLVMLMLACLRHTFDDLDVVVIVLVYLGGQ